MGSGSSKEKQPLPRKGDNVSKPTKPQIDNTSNRKQTSKDYNNETVATKVDKVNADSKGNDDYNRNAIDNKVSTNIINRDTKNGHIQRNENKNLGKFESDSESEAEDINDVLEATKNEYNRTIQDRHQQSGDTHYPETYAQRLQRQQYKNEPSGLLRQKTIYRNPEEWEVDDNEVDNFDVSKFKQANVHSKGSTEQSVQLNREIFSPSVPEVKEQTTRLDYDDNFESMKDRKQSLPHYDTSEEALLDEIEKEFEL